MAPLLIDPILAEPALAKRPPVCSDPSVVPPEGASEANRALWWLHGHPHSKRYANPSLTSLAALVRYSGLTYQGKPGFLYPVGLESSYEAMTWDEFDRLTESLAVLYAQNLCAELEDANRARRQPTVALLGGGNSVEYFCTQLSLMKLGVRVLLLAESNPPNALHHLLDKCDVSVVIIDAKNAKVEMQQVRKIKLIESLPRGLDVNPSELDSLRFQDFGDIWERHTFIIHSSGSTGLPKPIIHTNRSMMLIARMYRLFPDFEVKNWFLLFPLYHIAGISIALSGLPNGQVLSFPPRAWPPSSSAIFAAFKALDELGFPIDIVHCAPTLIENMYEFILDNGNDFTLLSSLKVLQPGGAELSSHIIRALVANNVNVKTTYGSTEIGPPYRTIPHTRDNPKCYSFRNLYPDNDKLKMEEVGDGLYECVVYRGFELAAELWDGSSESEPYHTNDLFIQDPPGSGFYVLQGRKDDMLVHTNGENTRAGALQLDIESSSRIIRRTLALGHARPWVALLVEVNDQYDPRSEDVKQGVWETIKQVNARYPGHSRIIWSLIYIVPRGSHLPVTPKGNVKRKEAEKLFAEDISQLYSTINDAQLLNGAEDSQEPLNEYLRNVFAKLADVSPEIIKNWTTLYDLGIDSRLALSLRVSLSKRKEIGPISLGTIFENPSIDSLLAFVREREKHALKKSRSQKMNQVISRLIAQISSWPSRPFSQQHDYSRTETILLTGASGSLGTALLQSLSVSPRISKIYAMVRGHDREGKLRKSFSSRGLDANLVLGSGKVEVINYSMEDPLLGLGVEEYVKLAQNVTIVIHNAWKMNFNQVVEHFEDDCVASTMFLLRLAHAGCRKMFAFMSSISTCLNASPAAVIPEASISGSTSMALNTGYAQSKYTIEQLVPFAASHLNVPICLLRVGQLCGNTLTGHWNPDEMWPIMFATCAKLNAVPDFPTKMVDWIPVDIAGQSIVEILMHLQYSKSSIDCSGIRESSHACTVHNIVNPHRVHWREVIAMLQHNIGEGRQLRIVSMVEWVKLLNRAADEGMSADELPGLRLLGFFENMAACASQRGDGEDNIEFDTAKSRLISPALAACEGYRVEWLDASVRKWNEDGFIGG